MSVSRWGRVVCANVAKRASVVTLPKQWRRLNVPFSLEFFIDSAIDVRFKSFELSDE